MKKNVLTLAIVLAMTTFSAHAQTVISLPTPQKNATMTLMQALQDRHSVRQFSNQSISDQTLSELLWAACGINRPEKKLLTVPSAMNRQDVSIYVCRADGAWLYNAEAHSLTKVCDNDLRASMERRPESGATAPITLVLVSDKGKFSMIDRDFCDLDCGYVSQNICLTAVALGLGTVPRAGMPKDELAKALGLSETQVVVLNHPIGVPE